MRKEKIIVLLSGLIWLISSQDVGVISFSLPAIKAIEKPSSTQIFWLASATNIGMLIGALISGPLADRIGRRKIIISFGFIHVIATLLGGLSPTVDILILLRTLVGFGVGGLLPVLASLVAEYSRIEDRGWNISLLESFWAYGWLIALLAAWNIQSVYGWRYYMMITGLYSIFIWLVSFKLPESVRYLAKEGRSDEVDKLLDKYGIEIPEISSEKLGVIDSLKILFTGKMALITISLWITWFMITMGYYGIFIWLPTMISKFNPLISGYLLQNRYFYLFIITLAQIPGYYSVVYLIDKVGRKPLLTLYLILTGVASFLYAYSSTIPELFTYGVILSFFDLGAWAALYTYTPEQYPTHIRATGSSWAGFWGRIGGILGPMMVPLLGGVSNWTSVFLFFASIHIVAGLSVLLGREMKGMEMPEL